MVNKSQKEMESIFYGGKPVFFRANNLSVNTWKSGPDICSLVTQEVANNRRLLRIKDLQQDFEMRGFWFLYFFFQKPRCMRLEINKENQWKIRMNFQKNSQ